jgi:hypothetical protein
MAFKKAEAVPAATFSPGLSDSLTTSSTWWFFGRCGRPRRHDKSLGAGNSKHGDCISRIVTSTRCRHTGIGEAVIQ